MSIDIGTLVISLQSDVAQIKKDMQSTKTIVGDAMSDVTAYVNAAKSAFIALGGVTSLGAFKDLVDGAIEAKAKLIDFNAETGISVENLGALRNIGKQTQTGLEDIASASAKMSKAIETQNEDSKGAAQAIAALGLNFNQFKQLKPEDQLLAVAHQMDIFQDGTGKTAAAMLLFGKNGATMLPFLKDLAGQTTLASEQTLEAAKQAKEFEDNLTKLKIASGLWRDSLINDMLPALTKFTQQMLEAKSAGDKFSTIWDNIKSNLGVDAFGLQIKKVAELNAEVKNAASAFETSMKVANSFPGGQTLLGGLVDANRKSLDDLRKQAADASDVLKTMAQIKSPVGGDPNYGNEGLHAPPKPKIGGLDADALKTHRDAYAELVKTVNERIAQMSAEADKGAALTDVEREQAKAYADIDAGVVKANLSQKLYIDGQFQEALALQALAKMHEQESKDNDKTLDDGEKRLEQLEAEDKAMQLQLDAFGHTAEELAALASGRDRYTASQLRGRAAALDDVGAEGQLRDLYIAQANALDTLAGKRDSLSAKQEQLHNDPTAGADKAVKDYLADVKAAGDATRDAVSSSIHGLEDITTDVLSGHGSKDAARKWVDGIISEVIRLQIVKPFLASIFGGNTSGGFGSILGALGTLLSIGSGSYNENYSNEGRGSVPTGTAAGGAGKAATLNYAPVIHIDSRTDQAVVATQTAQAVQQGNKQMLAILKSRGVI